jgi:hypothetical protein
VRAEFKGASLEVILSHLSDRTGCDIALDPRLCWAHGPAEFMTNVEPLARVLGDLERFTPEADVEFWRGVVFVSKAGEPLLIPQTPLVSSDWLQMATQARLTVSLVHTPLEEVAGFINRAWRAADSYAGKNSEYKADETIKDRQVTASFHDLPLDRAIDVICRLTETKLVENCDRGYIYTYTFKPREPAAPAPR